MAASLRTSESILDAWRKGPMEIGTRRTQTAPRCQGHSPLIVEMHRGGGAARGRDDMGRQTEVRRQCGEIVAKASAQRRCNSVVGF